MAKIRKLKVLVWGATAVDSAIVSSIAKSPLLDKLYLSKTNITVENLGIVLKEDGGALIRKAKELGIDFAIVNSIANDNGIIDAFNKLGIKAFGVNAGYTKLESSKAYAKKFMQTYEIPSSRFMLLKKLEDLDSAIEKLGLPIVLKPDGYSRGTGVEVFSDKSSAEKELKELLNGKYFDNSKLVVAEEYVEGRELSLTLIWNGKKLYQLPCVQDYKRLLDGNLGWNTGGMGAFCPVEVSKKLQKNLKIYINELEQAFKKEKAGFVGFVFCGLKITSNEEIKTLEFNMRLGDSEGQTILNYLETDFLELIWNIATNKDYNDAPKFKSGISASVNVCSVDYPRKNVRTSINKDFLTNKPDDIIVHFYNVEDKNSQYIIENNRFFSVCCCSENPFEKIYSFINRLKMKNCHFRRDIGKKYEK